MMEDMALMPSGLSGESNEKEGKILEIFLAACQKS